MDTNDTAAARQFVAQPPFWGSKVASITTPAWKNNPIKAHLLLIVGVFAFTAVVSVLFGGLRWLTDGGPERVQEASAYGFQYGLLLLLFGGVYGWTKWSRRRKIVISVSSDGLTVTTRPGDVYRFHDAKLGTWGVTGGATTGTALHLHCGSKAFHPRRTRPPCRCRNPAWRTRCRLRPAHRRRRLVVGRRLRASSRHRRLKQWDSCDPWANLGWRSTWASTRSE